MDQHTRRAAPLPTSAKKERRPVEHSGTFAPLRSPARELARNEASLMRGSDGTLWLVADCKSETPFFQRELALLNANARERWPNTLRLTGELPCLRPDDATSALAWRLTFDGDTAPVAG